MHGFLPTPTPDRIVRKNRHATIEALLLEHVMQGVLYYFRVTSKFFAMRESTLKAAFLTVPKGAVVETCCEFHESGIVKIKVGDQPLFAFMRDLREKTEPLGRATLVRTASVEN